jgi:hypothetical protein
MERRRGREKRININEDKKINERKREIGPGHINIPKHACRDEESEKGFGTDEREK